MSNLAGKPPLGQKTGKPAKQPRKPIPRMSARKRAHKAKAYRKIGAAAEQVEQGKAELRLIGLGVVDGLAADGKMAFLHVGQGVVEEATVQEAVGVASLFDFVQLLEVAVHKLTDGLVDGFGVQRGNVAPNAAEAFEEVATIDEDCCLHGCAPVKNKSPKGSALPGIMGGRTAKGRM